MAKNIAMASWYISRAKNTKGSGKMIKKQAKAQKYSPTNASIQASINRANPMAKEITFGPQVSSIKGAGEMEKGMARENGRRQIAATTKESGDSANPKVLGYMFLQTVLPTKENSKLP